MAIKGINRLKSDALLKLYMKNIYPSSYMQKYLHPTIIIKHQARAGVTNEYRQVLTGMYDGGGNCPDPPASAVAGLFFAH
jgi:hypothetical protein